ncbi:MAG: 30S ribosomal protein S16 [Clostridia bacterium]|nr:30S ribosomal protein S16 [Clostridia bacterium]MBR2397855.1 30S ribosomal protein S16 [Clostridia bacterium]
MAVKMRLTRLGAKKAPTYRIVVCDSRCARDAEYIENLGHYNPQIATPELVINAERAQYWLSKGVQPTETVKSLLVKAGVIEQGKFAPAKTKVKKSK